MSVERFIGPNQEDFETALSEIKSGKKKNHWIWYIFPQVKGLGFSSTSQYFGMNSLKEAEEFLNHPVLGTHLIKITEALLERSETAEEIFGYPDYLKVKSSMTLFELAEESMGRTDLVFTKVLQKFYDGERCSKTLSILESMHS